MTLRIKHIYANSLLFGNLMFCCVGMIFKSNSNTLNYWGLLYAWNYAKYFIGDDCYDWYFADDQKLRNFSQVHISYTVHRRWLNSNSDRSLTDFQPWPKFFIET